MTEQSLVSDAVAVAEPRRGKGGVPFRESGAGLSLSRRAQLRFVLGFVAFWAVMATVEIVDVLQRPQPGPAPTPATALLVALNDAGSWCVLSLAGFAVTSRFPIWRRPWRNVPILVACAVVCTVARSVFLSTVPPSPMPIAVGLRMRFVKDLMGYVFILGSCVGLVAFVDARERERRTLKMAAHLAQARLAVLKGQLQPHFLFNTLNSVSALVHSDPSGAQRVVARLGEMLRATLDLRDLHEVSLREEVELLQPYREIQHVRFGDRIRMEVSIAPDVAGAAVPHLLLQPLVENAFEHGAGQVARDGRVRVRAWGERGRLYLRVEDNGPGFSAAQQRPARATGSGMALQNARSRLRELYGDRASLRTFDGAEGEGGAVVEVVLPLETAAAPELAGGFPSAAPAGG